ncbi:hypothetical protein EXIGLDRAFT_787757 [Exidia glandulosa HHB12029]|uniref:Integral membrane protein n=1 Tax=Exidia glandulosa HHB12029 TaxID=1314781 RepID=A0A166AMX5_EXIGL|nr:hypothetical protein EXIGLDRAFT_787757 [Exidia glandulosa HHB12029]
MAGFRAGFVILISLFLAGHVWASANFSQCISQARDGMFGTTGLVDLYGQPTTNASAARGLTLATCEAHCGTDRTPFDWYLFSQEFSSWLLPWLALASQLPFGATTNAENILAFLMAIGSPALAVYSLSLTLLQRRWIHHRFADMVSVFPNASRISRVLVAQEQMSLRLAETGEGGDALLESLIVLPENEKWWETLAERIDGQVMWNIPAAVSIFWTVLALVFTLVDSIIGSDVDVSFHGHAVGAVWLWLIPVVGGWMRAGFESNPARIAREVDDLNETAAFVARHGDSDVPALARDHTLYRALTVNVRGTGQDEDCPAPIFEYARIFKTSAQVERIALMCDAVCEHLRRREPVAFARREWSITSPKDNLRGTASEVVRYCATSRGSHWAQGVWERIGYAAFTAIFMQWITTGAAVYITYQTPTTGLGCRSGAFLIYGIIATISWFLLLLATALSHASESPGSGHPSQNQVYYNTICTTLRITGKVLAALNAIWIVTLCMFQFTGIWNTCFCMSGVWSRGKGAYVMLGLTWAEHVQLGTRNVWIGGMALTGLGAGLYSVFIKFVLRPED